MVAYQYFFVLVVMAATAGWFLWQQRQLAKVTVDIPVLLSNVTAGMRLQKVSDGSLGGYPYTLMISAPYEVPDSDVPIQFSGSPWGVGGSLTTNSTISPLRLGTGQIIMTLTLPVKTSVHIVGMGIADTSVQSAFLRTVGSYNLESVELEGDFPDYFTLLCQKDKQMEVREVLDPTAMAFLVDFCKHQDWEILDNALYFCQSDAARKQDKTDQTSMTQDAQTFVEKILPVLQRMSMHS